MWPVHYCEQSNPITIMAKTDVEEEISLPKGISPPVIMVREGWLQVTVIKMAQELLPKGLNLSRDTHDLILAFAVEFIQMLTYQANEICQKETNNGYIALQHVVRACEELGFEEYVCEIQAVTTAYDRQIRMMQKVCTPVTGLMSRRRLRRWGGGLRGVSWMSWRWCRRRCWRNRGNDLNSA
jgi:down-regulator of transcription 1